MQIELRTEVWPLQRPFTIARERIDALPLAYCAIEHDGATGRAEAVGVDYRGETPDTVVAQASSFLSSFDAPPSRATVLAALPAGGARNLVDCALWDWEAKHDGRPAWQIARAPYADRLVTAYTLSLDAPTAMADAVGRAPTGAPLKLKLGGPDDFDVARVRAVRAAAPDATLLVDVNEGWTLARLNEISPRLADLGVVLIEQPLLAGHDAELDRYTGPVPLCADESFDDSASLAAVRGRYACVNIKLDKAGGLTAALAAADRAAAEGLDLFVGCMLGTSLGMAPAFMLGARCRWVDLDGPLLLADDRATPITYDGAVMHAPPRALWG